MHTQSACRVLGNLIDNGLDALSAAEFGTPSASSASFAALENVAGIDGLDAVLEIGGMNVQPVAPGVPIAVQKGKWRLAKAASVKYAKDKASGALRLVADTGKDGSKSNLPGLKLSVVPKTGVFKGSYTVYAIAGTLDRPKIKKYKFSVAGVAADGEGAGFAVCKKPYVAVPVVVKTAD